MKTYWFSFSYKGKNKGVCIIQAVSDYDAKQQAKLIAPLNDDVYACEVGDMSLEHPSLEYNKLYSQKDMEQFGYVSVKSTK